MKAPGGGLASETLSSAALLNTHVLCAFPVLNTKVCAKGLYAHIPPGMASESSLLSSSSLRVH